ncbi:efflux RND transporter permease subunit [Peijinzhouia sedimentorum]
MVKFLIQRPIAVIMTTILVIIFSVLSALQLPVSLLPEIDVPEIVVKANYPNASPSIMENNILKPIRERLRTVSGLEYLESKAGSETGTIHLRFAYGTQMDLAYIDVNEKMDRLSETLPRDITRPQIVRINTSDIPVIRIQVKPRSEADLTDVSELTEKVLKKRIEQLEGVSLVDVNGLQRSLIQVEPYREKLLALGLTEANIAQTIQTANLELSTLSVADGQYRYFLKVANRLDNPEEIESLPVRARDGTILKLRDVAKISIGSEKILGYHLIGKDAGLVITAHKQASAKMNELMPRIYEAIEYFKDDYPNIDFEVTQDQSILLNAGIGNLQTSLLFGGAFAFAVLFLFIGSVRLPIIIGISLPLSVVISFLLFRVTGLSINIISLSGLALGLGMLIDNSIIVLDNITRHRKEGLPLIDACVKGVNEVMSALISSVLTTLAVFVPLIFLSGITGALFFDQAVSVAIVLGVSLLVAFIVLPLLYRLFFENSKKKYADDSKGFLFIHRLYKKAFGFTLRYKAPVFIILFLLIPFAILLGLFLPTAGLPEIEKTETQVTINWNEPIEVDENRRRVMNFFDAIPHEVSISESDIGINQFLLFQGNNSVENALIYFMFPNMDEKQQAEKYFREYFSLRFPLATIQIEDAPNAFDQLFASEKPYFEARFRNLGRGELIEWEKIEPLAYEAAKFTNDSVPIFGDGLIRESVLQLNINSDRIRLYNLSENDVKEKIKNSFSNYLVTEIKRFGEVTPVVIRDINDDLSNTLKRVTVRNNQDGIYTLDQFIDYEFTQDYKYLTASDNGVYHSIIWDELENEEDLSNELVKLAGTNNLLVDFQGRIFDDKENLRQLIFILIVSVVLLYFILSAQFESFSQPIIIVLTLPLGLGGAFLVLLTMGESMNIMSSIGMIVMLGIMVNDAILKVDTMNRYMQEKLQAQGLSRKLATSEFYNQLLEEAMLRAGTIRLKPILMTSITTILALLPVVFSSGLGADLQRPLVYSVIGGLTIGTFTAIFFIPLAYWFLQKKRA